MREPDFWTKYAEAMELSIEGNRLIAREISGLIRDIWKRAVGSIEAGIRGLGHLNKRLPPA